MLSDYPEFKVATDKGIDAKEAEQDDRPITQVQVEGLVILKILQHAHEYVAENVVGQVMGLGNGDVLEITHSFPLQSQREVDESDPEAKRAAETYQSQVQSSLAQVNVDSNVVGWYQVNWQEGHYNPRFVEIMSTYQSELNEHTVCLLLDPLKSLQGKLHLKAVRLRSTFMRMLEENSDKKDFSQHIINNYQATSADIFYEVPISVNNCQMVDQFLWELGRSSQWHKGTTEENLVARDMALSPYQNINAGSLVENAESVLDELKKYLTLTRRNRQMQDDDRSGGRPSRLDTLYYSAQIHGLSKHVCDISQLAFESVSLTEALQQAQSQPTM